MKTKLHICYKYVGLLGPAPAYSLVGGLVSVCVCVCVCVCVFTEQ